MEDKYKRTIDYLRLSITDRCNLRCIYCIPLESKTKIKHREILDYERLIKIVKVAARLGLKKIRITGGEPLSRPGVVNFIEKIKAIESIEDISLTTNGILLEKLAPSLASAGLNRVNVSLDSLKGDKYREITRGGSLDSVLRGIAKAQEVGLTPLKINNVPVRGINDDEIETFAKLTIQTPYHVRFIEFMPIGGIDLWSPLKYISLDEIQNKVLKIAPLIPVKVRTNGPARYFKFHDAIGVLGFISALTHHFCKDCNRLRITCDGKIRPCLFSDNEIDLKPAFDHSDSEYEIEKLLRLAIQVKPEGHFLSGHQVLDNVMSGIGG